MINRLNESIYLHIFNHTLQYIHKGLWWGQIWKFIKWNSTFIRCTIHNILYVYVGVCGTINQWSIMALLKTLQKLLAFVSSLILLNMLFLLIYGSSLEYCVIVVWFCHIFSPRYFKSTAKHDKIYGIRWFSVHLLYNYFNVLLNCCDSIRLEFLLEMDISNSQPSQIFCVVNQ